MTLSRALSLFSPAVLAAFALSCSGSPSSAPTAATGNPVAPVASPSTPTPQTSPTTQSCPFGFGSLETFCGRSGAEYGGDVNVAIDRVVQEHPDYFETSNTNGPGGFRVLRPQEYQAGVAAALQQAGFCAETNDDVLVLKKGNVFSETYDILLATGHIRRGGYRESCNPPSFPVDPTKAIAYVRVAFYSIVCDAGLTPPRNGENVLPIGCRGFVTATPKRPNNEDVPRHIIGEDISWTFDQAGDIANIVTDDHNAFNKQVVGRNAGRYTLCATSHGVEGCQHGEIVPDPR